MNDLQPKTSTLLEVARGLMVSRDLVEKRVKELFPDKMKKGVKTYLNEYEVTAVKCRIKENTSLATSDDRRRLVDMPKTALEKKLIVAQAIQIMQEEIQIVKAENEQLKIELDESKRWHTVKKVKTLGYIKDIPARKAWSPLRKWSLANDYQVKEIEDVNYGKVKVYHADAWNAVYGVKL